MDRLLGLLRVRVLRGVHLAVRDLRSSDPYVVLHMGKQGDEINDGKGDEESRKRHSNIFHDSDFGIRKLQFQKKLKTRVIKQNLNPEWNEELTLSVEDPSVPIKLKVYDRDLFSFDDPMGDSEFDIKTLYEVVKMNLEGILDGSVIATLIPSRKNCLAEESLIYLENGKIMQDMFLRLRNVECGEIQLQLQWIHLPNAKTFQVL